MAIARSGVLSLLEAQNGNNSWAHDSGAGANTSVLVLIIANTATPPTVTYNSVSMSVAVSQAADGTYLLYAYHLEIGTGLGSKTVAVTTGATDWYGFATSYSGSKQTGQFDASSGGSSTYAVTSVADNCWQVSWIWSTNGALTANAPWAIIGAGSVNPDLQVVDSGQALTPAGSHTTSVNEVGTTYVLNITLAPAVTASIGIEWRAPAVQLTNHQVTSIVNMRATTPQAVPALTTQGASVTQPVVTDVQLQPYFLARERYLRATSPMPVPYLRTTPTRVTNPLDWVLVTPDVIWTDG